MNPLTLLGGMNPWLILGLVLFYLASITTAFVKGEHAERAAWVAKQAEVLAGQLREVERLSQANNKLVQDYQKVEAKRNEYYRKLQNEIAAATRGERCLGDGAVRVWNSALGAVRDLPNAPARAPQATAGTGATDTEVLENFTVNMKQYAECRDIHQKIRESEVGKLNAK